MPSHRVDRENARFQHIEVLRRNRHKRTHHGEAFVEGVRPINAAREFGWEFTSVWYPGETELSGWARGVIEGAGPRAVEASPRLFAQLSDREDPSELVATVRIPPDRELLTRLDPPGPVLGVLLDRPQSPGNLGSAIRSADALGADFVAVTGHAADVFDPVTIRASTGAVFAIPVLRLESPAPLSEWCARRNTGVRWFGTDSAGTISLGELDLTAPCVLVIGNEARGLSAALRERCDATARIPQQGRAADSLNMAAAASIALYEAWRQRNP